MSFEQSVNFDRAELFIPARRTIAEMEALLLSATIRREELERQLHAQITQCIELRGELEGERAAAKRRR